jgi:hypothetical protein
MRFALLAWLVASLIAAGEEIPRAKLVVGDGTNAVAGESVSRSMQFRVSGGEGAVRGTVAILADQTKDELLRLTEERDEWKVPIRVMLFGKEGDPSPPRSIVMELFFTDSGFDPRVNVHLGRGLEQERFANAITSALILERTLRGRKAEESETPYYVPPWLVDGLREATAWNQKRSDRRTYETLFKRGGLFKLDELFAVNASTHADLDAATRLAFQVSSGALVMALLEQPQGKEGFRAFLTQVAGFQGEMPVLLRRHFPELNQSEDSLAKWWALQLANKGAAPLTDSLSIAETERSLNEVLKLHFRDSDGSAQERPLSAWKDVAAMKEAERGEAVRPAQDGLVRLSYRSFPSYRSLLLEYQTVLSSLSRGKTEKVEASLASLEASRELMRRKAERARDFLDWFEITRARQTSGEFDDYLKLKDRLNFKSVKREDDLSKYLDRMDEMFKHAQGEPQTKSAMPSLLPSW